MNKARRAELAKASSLLEDAKALIEAACNDEQEAFDNLAEGLKQTTMSTAIDLMTSALEGIENAINDTEEAQA